MIAGEVGEGRAGKFDSSDTILIERAAYECGVPVG